MLISGFIFGLLGSFHCVGMCGPVAFLLPIDRKSKMRSIFQLATYHFGRLLSYATLGLMIGLLGKGLNLFGLQQQLSVVIGLLMLAVIILPSRVLPGGRLTKPIYRMISQIKSRLGKQLKRRNADTFLIIGILNGFLPCGLVYLAVFGTLTMESLPRTVFYMLLFGLGTVPLMSAAIYLGNFLSLQIRQRIQRLIPVFVAVIAILFIIRGLGLGIPYLSPEPMAQQAGAIQSCHTP